MPITDHQRRLRRAHLGSSDAPAVLGLSPWRNASDVYWSKVADSEDKPTEAMQTGNRLEGPLLDFAAERLNLSLVRNQFRVAQDHGGILAANFDGLAKDAPFAVECKYVGPQSAGDWGEPGTDEIPEHVLAQVQHQIYVGNLDRVWVAAAIARYQLQWEIYEVARHDPLIEMIVAREVEFWRKHIEPQIPPTDEPCPLEILKAIRREPASIVELDGKATEAVQLYQTVANTKKEAERQVKQAQAAVIELLGTAEAGRLPDGRLVTYMQQKCAAYEVPAKEFRVLRIKETKQ